GVRLRDADEAVHDAPDRAEQADEGGSRADRGKDTGAARHFAAGRLLDALELPGDALLEAVAAQARGKPDLVSGRLHQKRGRAGAVAELLVGLRERRAILQRAQVAPYCRARAAQF